LNSDSGLLCYVKVLPEETGFKFGVDAKHIMHYQYLPITIATSTNTNGGNGQALRNFFC